MIRFWVCVAIWISAARVEGQQPYFQQELHYNITVNLDDRQHRLDAHLSLKYKNNAPDTLPYLYFHCWPNAYRGRDTEYNRQNLRNNDLGFHFSRSEDKGGIDRLSFRAGADTLHWVYDTEHPDIVRVDLVNPLAPGEEILLEIPFSVRIPASFSRLGRADDSYQVTQWYPKPAVYDRDGWHPMPYLNQGEFYAEFGSFDVSVTLPPGYVIAATGTLQTLEERAALLQWANGSAAPRPEHFERSRTVKYTADKVHDFAWFADKTFLAEMRKADTGGGGSAEAWVFYRPENAAYWKNAGELVARALEFYSGKVGSYPYPHATAVDGALSAGGGMEYPMITVIGRVGSRQSLDRVIAHEVGHNWFYGTLASNERDHPWLDEGLNSFYENWYMDTYYPGNSKEMLPAFLAGGVPLAWDELLYRVKTATRTEQPVCSHSMAFDDLGYGLSAYFKPAMIMAYLRDYVGQSRLNGCMNSYYEEWKFRHPGPDDFRDHLEDCLGEDLDWLFDGMLCSTSRVKARISGIGRMGDSLAVHLRQSGIAAPLRLEISMPDADLRELWVPGFLGDTVVYLSARADTVRIDPERTLWQADRLYHSYAKARSGRFLATAGGWRLRFLGGADPGHSHLIYMLPFLGANQQDGIMPGVVLHNISFPPRDIEWFLAPMFGLESRRLVGLGDLGYYCYPSGAYARYFRFGLSVRSFDYDVVDDLAGNGGLAPLRFVRLSPSLEWHLPSNTLDHWYHRIRARTIYVLNEQEQGGFSRQLIHELGYRLEKRGRYRPRSFDVLLEQQGGVRDDGGYLRLSVAWEQKWNVGPGRRYFTMRAFAGSHIYNTSSNRQPGINGFGDSNGLFSLFPGARLDYRLDEWMIGRGQRSGLGGRQTFAGDGAFKLPVFQMNALAASSSYLIAVNLYSDIPGLPGWFPLQPYLDLGYQPGPALSAGDNRFYWACGVSVSLFREVLKIHFPVAQSSALTQVINDAGGGYFNRVTFSWKLGRFRLREVLESPSVFL